MRQVNDSNAIPHTGVPRPMGAIRRPAHSTFVVLELRPRNANAGSAGRPGVTLAATMPADIRTSDVYPVWRCGMQTTQCHAHKWAIGGWREAQLQDRLTLAIRMKPWTTHQGIRDENNQRHMHVQYNNTHYTLKLITRGLDSKVLPKAFWQQ